MAKFVFVNLPFQAHINPTLPVVQELVRRGDEVVYYLTAKYQQAIEATGARFCCYRSLLEQPGSDAQQESHPLALPMQMVDEACSVMGQILESVRAVEADCIVYNPLCLSGRFIAQMLQIPAVISRAFFVSHENNLRTYQFGERDPEVGKKIQASMQQLCTRYPIAPFNIMSMFFHKEPLNIVYIPRSFQPYGDSFGAEYLFVGPSIGMPCETEDFPFAQLGKAPLVYITSGTIFNHNPDFFKMCFDAFADQPFQVVMTTGRLSKPLDLGPIPDNFLVCSYVPQFEVLQRASLCIHHGGMATIMDCISLGIPMVAIPQAANQQPMARRVAETGLGVFLEKESVTAESLRSAAIHCLEDPTVRLNLQRMQEEARCAGGFKAATDGLQRFVGELR
ncbi:MAG TPA: macrolide family glycosyltransferase [Ktedonobacteraceae bacterium]|nr:macrolide family glycosyltransferase [Ktedonobacteraceae bacterium]